MKPIIILGVMGFWRVVHVLTMAEGVMFASAQSRIHLKQMI